ncbi:MAG: efflux transporter outer membrane subunit [Candidatus Andeanibacterium colombiense]|uniref:Efflux transporter outer membrane subunit n=1 Tax=Candidatus Andeanibacterium colombiense TaxID=3121345 RepID=A0AAJ6BMJ5_9SPHN|nr:MAG: efflux transporter outer membrane subunit [Sphingomonadaceae bacterium]
MKKVLALSALLLAGCTTVGPDYERPAAPADGAYVPPAPPAGAPAAALGQGPATRWWEAFGSPELDELVDRAIAGNQTLAASNATLERARERIAALAGERLPQVDVNPGASRQEVNLASFGFDPASFGITGGNPIFNLYSVGGGVSYDLDLFGGKKRAIEQAAAQAEAQLHEAEAAHLTIAGRVVNQALTIAAIRARIATATAVIDDGQRNFELTDARRRAGKGNMVDVLQAQSCLTADKAALPQLEQQLAEARNMLAILLGIAPTELGATDFDMADFTLPANVPVALPSALVHQRPDILQAEADLHAATAGVGVATAKLYPDITLGATLTQSSPGIGSILDEGFRAFDIFAGVTAPIFHGGTLKAEKRGAEAETRAAAATYRETVIEAFGQVANLLGALDTDARGLAAQQDAAAIAEQSRELSQKAYRAGSGTVLQVIDADRTWQQARAGLDEARARQLLNVARLYVATAGGWTGPAQAAR